MKLSNLPIRLERSLKGKLPGYKAHQKMGVSGHYSLSQPPENCHLAGVMALLFPKDNKWKLTFIKRSNRYPDDRHKGQIGFPGGRLEDVDIDLKSTALRELNEEIGVQIDSVNVLGQLSELYIPVSNYLVYPFVGYLNTEPEFTLQKTEVDGLITPDFDVFFNKSIVKSTVIEIATGIHIRNVPYYDLDGEVLWGATAMIMSELLHILELE